MQHARLRLSGREEGIRYSANLAKEAAQASARAQIPEGEAARGEYQASQRSSKAFRPRRTQFVICSRADIRLGLRRRLCD